MDFYVALPNGLPGVTFQDLVDITDAAEELGFTGVMALDHVLVGPDLKERYPWVLEPMVALGYLAARTRRLRLATSVIVLGMRNPFVVAKQAATLDLASEGRFTLGLGAGYSEPEFSNVGAAGVWTTRGKRLDEAIALFRHLWSGSSKPFKGEFYSYDQGWFAPAPAQGDKLPILIGGHSEAALNRAARLGDIWQSTGLAPDEFKKRADWVRTHAGNRHVEVGARTTLLGEPDALRTRVKEYEVAGAEHVCANFGKTPSEYVANMRRFAGEVMPALRA